MDVMEIASDYQAEFVGLLDQNSRCGSRHWRDPTALALD
jgi:hypothetical protein